MRKKLSVLFMTFAITAMSIVNSFATSSTGPDFSGVTTAIQGAGTSVMSEGIKVIGAAISVGIIFWGAQLLWSKFRSMSGGGSR